MAIGTVVGLIVIAFLVVACVLVFRRPTAAEAQREREVSRLRGGHENTGVQRRPGAFGGH